MVTGMQWFTDKIVSTGGTYGIPKELCTALGGRVVTRAAHFLELVTSILVLAR